MESWVRTTASSTAAGSNTDIVDVAVDVKAAVIVIPSDIPAIVDSMAAPLKIFGSVSVV